MILKTAIKLTRRYSTILFCPSIAISFSIIKIFIWEEIWWLTDASLNRCSPIEKRRDDVIGKKKTKFVKL